MSRVGEIHSLSNHMRENKDVKGKEDEEEYTRYCPRMMETKRHLI